MPSSQNLFDYAKELTKKVHKEFASGEVFAKVLTSNDDSGRHGVLIPSDAYPYFPDFPIPDPTVNATETFVAFDAVSHSSTTLAYKYYERYPERRITRLNGILNSVSDSPRILVFLHAKHQDGSSGYYFDSANSALGGRFQNLFRLIFGEEIGSDPGNFVVRPVDSPAFAADTTLNELLGKFDDIRRRGWIDTMRSGHTGIGYTFETLVGIKENNEGIADFKGIELKCQGIKEGDLVSHGKLNLFQNGPIWVAKMTAKERIRILGEKGDDGLYACYSQVTTSPNNRGVMLEIINATNQIDLRKNTTPIGYWSFNRLEKRLMEKHSRAAFVKAKTRTVKSGMQFNYEELVYCERPSIKRFVDLVASRNIVFEFLMSEKENGRVRNHGYPWRLCRSEFLDQLFAFQIKLR